MSPLKNDESIEEVHQSSSVPFSLTPARLGDAAHLITQSFLENQGAGLERSILSFGSRENQIERDWDFSQTEVTPVCTNSTDNSGCNSSNDALGKDTIDIHTVDANKWASCCEFGFL